MSAPGPVRAAKGTSRSDWETPRPLFEYRHRVWQFDVDAAANEANHQLPVWFGPGGVIEDAFAGNWREHGRNFWVNPPYGRGIADWVSLFERESLCGCRVEALLPANTDTRWFAHCATTAATITLLRPRIGFWLNGQPLPPKDDANPGGSMLVRWEPFGTANNALILSEDWKSWWKA